MSTGTDTDNALLATTDAAEYLGSTGSTGGWYKINDLINAAAQRFNAETGRLLKSRSHTEYYDGNGTASLYLNHWPISSTTITITIDADRAFTSTGDVVTSTDVMLSTELGLVRLDGHTFETGEKNVKVEYSAGYSTAAAFDLVLASKEMVQLMWNRMDKKDLIGVRSESFEGGSRAYETDLPWSVKKVLDMYRDKRQA